MYITLCLALVLASIGTTLVRRTKPFSKVVAYLLARTLGWVQSNGTCNVSRTNTGAVVQDLRAEGGVLPLHGRPVYLRAVHVKLAEVSWPSLSSPVKIYIHGARLEFEQKQMPKAGRVGDILNPHKGKLLLLEQLLWHGREKAPTTLQLVLWGLLPRVGAWASYLVCVEVSNLSIQYYQVGEPGPWNVGVPACVQDGLLLNIRSVTWGPHQKVHAERYLAQEEVMRMAAPVGSPGKAEGWISLGVSGVSLQVVSRMFPAVPSPSGNQHQDVGRGPRRHVGGEGAQPAGVVDTDTIVSSPGAEPGPPVSDPSWQVVGTVLRQWFAEVTVGPGSGTPSAPEVPLLGGSTDPASAISLVLQTCTASRSPQGPSPVRVQVIRQAEQRSNGREMQCDGEDLLDRAVGEAGTWQYLCGLTGWRGSLSATGCQVAVEVRLKSLQLELEPLATATCMRLLNRYQSYEQFSTYWRVRPRTPIRENPAAWWRHGCRMVQQACRQIAPSRNALSLLTERRQYMDLYLEVHRRQGDLGRRATGEPSLRRLDKKTLSTRLELLEAHMTAAEIATYRTLVALKHSPFLQSHPSVHQQWLEALDMLTMFVDLIPSRIDFSEAQEQKLLALTIRLTCPGIGLNLVPGVPALPSSSDPMVTPALPERSAILSVQLEDLSVSVPGHNQLLVDAGGFRVVSHGRAQPAGKGRDSTTLLQVPMPREHHSKYCGLLGFAHPHLHQHHRERPKQRLEAIYPGGLVAQYLQELKVAILPLEIVLETSALLDALRYVAEVKQADPPEMVRVQSAPSARPTREVLREAEPLRQVILRSYKQHHMPVPQTLASFVPEIELWAPCLLVRLPLRSDAMPLSSALQECAGHEGVLQLQDTLLKVGYHTSCYGALVRQARLSTSCDVVFVSQPKTKVGAAVPEVAPYGSLWLHPEDAGLVLSTPQERAVPVRRSTVGPAALSRMIRPAAPSRLAQSQGCLWRNVTAGTVGSGTSQKSQQVRRGSRPGSSLPLTLPFSPLLRVRQVSLAMSDLIPGEPAVPGQHRSNYAVHTSGVCVWLSPWQMDLLQRRMEQTWDSINQLNQAFGSLAVRQTVEAPEAVEGSSTRTPTTTQEVLPSSSQNGAVPPSVTTRATTSVSFTSVLVDVPLIELLLFVAEDSNMEGKQAAGQSTVSPSAARQLSSPFGACQEGDLQPSQAGQRTGYGFTLTKSMRQYLSCHGSCASAVPGTLYARWASCLYPAVSWSIKGLRGGAYKSASSDFVMQATVNTLVMTDLQAGQLEEESADIFSTSKNIGTPVVNVGGSGMEGRQKANVQTSRPTLSDLEPLNLTGVPVLFPCPSRAKRALRYVRDRRRLLLGLQAVDLDSREERRGVAQLRWQRLLELRLMQHTIDYSLFLLNYNPRNFAGLLPPAALQYKKLYHSQKQRAGNPPNQEPPPSQASSDIPASSLEKAPRKSVLNLLKDMRTSYQVSSASPIAQSMKSSSHSLVPPDTSTISEPLVDPLGSWPQQKGGEEPLDESRTHDVYFDKELASQRKDKDRSEDDLWVKLDFLDAFDQVHSCTSEDGKVVFQSLCMPQLRVIFQHKKEGPEDTVVNLRAKKSTPASRSDGGSEPGAPQPMMMAMFIENWLNMTLGQLHVDLGGFTVSLLAQLTEAFLKVLTPTVAEPSPAPTVPTPTPGTSPRIPPSPMNLVASLSLCCLTAKLSVDQVKSANDERQTQVSFEQPLASTKCRRREVVQVLVLGAEVKLEPHWDQDLPLASAAQPVEIPGYLVDLRLSHLGVLDLQASLEHRHALSVVNILSSGSMMMTASSTSLQHGYEDNCTLQVHLFLSCGGAAPTKVAVLMVNPRLLILRRFVNNVLAYVQEVSKELKQLAERFKGRGTSSGPSNTSGTGKGTPAPGPAPPGQEPSTNLRARLVNLQVILPASHAAKKGPVKHAVDPNALAINVQELMLGPGSGHTGGTNDFFDSHGLSLMEWMTDSSAVGQFVTSSLLILDNHYGPQPEEEAAPCAEGVNQRSAGEVGNPPAKCDISSGHKQEGMQGDPGLASLNRSHFATEAKVGADGAGGTPSVPGNVGLETLTKVLSPSKISNNKRFSSALKPQAAHTLRPQYLADRSLVALSVDELDRGVLVIPGHQAPSKSARLSSRDAPRKVHMEDNQGPVAPPGLTSGLYDSAPMAVPHTPMAGSSGRAPTAPATGQTGGGPVTHSQASLLVHLAGLEAFSCQIVPGNPVPRKGRRSKSSLPYEYYVKDGHVKKLQWGYAWCSLTNMEPVIEGTQLKAAVISSTDVGGVILHLGFPHVTVADLGPSSYDKILQVCTHNLVDSFSTFNITEKKPEPHRLPDVNYNPHLNLTLTKSPALFTVTAGWTQGLQVNLKNSPNWWVPGLLWAPRQNSVPFLWAELMPASFSLQVLHSGKLQLSVSAPKHNIHDVRLAHSPWVDPSDDVLHEEGSPAGELFQYGVDTDSSNIAPELRRAQSWHGLADGWEEETFGRAHLDDDGWMEEEELDCDVPDMYPPVLRYEHAGVEAPVVALLQTVTHLPTSESAHLRPLEATAKGTLGSGQLAGKPGVLESLKVSFVMLHDGTMVVEVKIADALIQWPFLADMSLVNAIVSIFVPTWLQKPAALIDTLKLSVSPWLYFNLLIRNSEVFIPLLSGHLPPLAPGAPGYTLFYGALRDAFQSNIDGAQEYTLQDKGLALTFGALRFGYFYGGDGEVLMKVDLRNAAGYVRDPHSCMSVCLLPLRSAVMEWHQSCPVVSEHKALLPLLILVRRAVVAYKIRTRARLKEVREAPVARKKTDHGLSMDGSEGTLSLVGSLAAMRGPLAGLADTPERELLRAALTHAYKLAQEHNLDLPKETTRDQQVYNSYGIARQPRVNTIVLSLEPVVVRGSFSNVTFWKTAAADLSIIQQLMQTSHGLFGAAPLLLEPPPPSRSMANTVTMSAPGPSRISGPQAPSTSTRSMPHVAGVPNQDPGLTGQVKTATTGWAAEFRRSLLHVSLDFAEVSLVICDDKPQSFGAPDVCQVTAGRISLQYDQDLRVPDVAAEYKGKLDVELRATFLNSSYSRWERLLDPWRVSLAFSNPLNPIFMSSRTFYATLHSPDSMKAFFHPASLLTFGDSLSFVRALTDVDTDASQGREMEQQGETGPNRNNAERPSPPLVEDQLGIRGLTIRVPQRFLIHNQTGLNIWYWSQEPAATRVRQLPTKKMFLPSYKSEQLKVDPNQHQVKILGTDETVVSRIQASAICVQLEGNWMPLQDVMLDVVGKYRYTVMDPHGDNSWPLIVDVMLVGRTKVLKLHSGIRIENHSALRLGFRLQLSPLANGTPLVLAVGDSLDSNDDVLLKPLRPKEGRFLPVLAALSGVLYAIPGGYAAATHDVIRLSTSVASIRSQEGYIRCEAEDGATGRAITLAVQVTMSQGADLVFSTQNLLDVKRPGEFYRVNSPLEVVIKLAPPVVLTNALPYFLEGCLVAMGNPVMMDDVIAPQATYQPGCDFLAMAGRGAGDVDHDSISLARPGLPPTDPMDQQLRDKVMGLGQGDLVNEFVKLARLFPRLTRQVKIDQLRQKLLQDLKLEVLRALRAEFMFLIERFYRPLDPLKRFLDNPSLAYRSIPIADMIRMMRWLYFHTLPITLKRGETQCFYEDMSGDLYIVVRVPQLSIASKPTVIWYGVTDATRADLPNKLPMRLVGPEAAANGFDHQERQGSAMTRRLRRVRLTPQTSARQPLAVNTLLTLPEHIASAADLPLVKVQLEVVDDEVLVNILPADRGLPRALCQLLLKSTRRTAALVQEQSTEVWSTIAEHFAHMSSGLKDEQLHHLQEITSVPVRQVAASLAGAPRRVRNVIERVLQDPNMGVSRRDEQELVSFCESELSWLSNWPIQHGLSAGRRVTGASAADTEDDDNDDDARQKERSTDSVRMAFKQPHSLCLLEDIHAPVPANGLSGASGQPHLLSGTGDSPRGRAGGSSTRSMSIPRTPGSWRPRAQSMGSKPPHPFLRRSLSADDKVMAAKLRFNSPLQHGHRRLLSPPATSPQGSPSRVRAGDLIPGARLLPQPWTASVGPSRYGANLALKAPRSGSPCRGVQRDGSRLSMGISSNPLFASSSALPSQPTIMPQSSDNEWKPPASLGLIDERQLRLQGDPIQGLVQHEAGSSTAANTGEGTPGPSSAIVVPMPLTPSQTSTGSTSQGKRPVIFQDSARPTGGVLHAKVSSRNAPTTGQAGDEGGPSSSQEDCPRHLNNKRGRESQGPLSRAAPTGPDHLDTLEPSMARRQQGPASPWRFRLPSRLHLGRKRRVLEAQLPGNRCPKLLTVGITGSHQEGQSREVVCKVTLFSHLWLENRSGMGMFVKDHAKPGLRPLVASTDVWCPGFKRDAVSLEQHDQFLLGGFQEFLDSESACWDKKKLKKDKRLAKAVQAVYQVNPVLLNHQRNTALRVKDPTGTISDLSVAFKVGSVGIKKELSVKGPKVLLKEPERPEAPLRAPGSTPHVVLGTGTPGTILRALKSQDVLGEVSIETTQEGTVAAGMSTGQGNTSWQRRPGCAGVSSTRSFSLPSLSGTGPTVDAESTLLTQGQPGACNPEIMVPSGALEGANDRSSGANLRWRGNAQQEVELRAEAQQPVLKTGSTFSSNGGDPSGPSGGTATHATLANQGLGPGESSQPSAKKLSSASDLVTAGRAAPRRDASDRGLRQHTETDGSSVHIRESLEAEEPFLQVTRRPTYQQEAFDPEDSSSVTDTTQGEGLLENVYVQRVYNFAVEVWSAPPTSVFRHTRIVTIKSKYILLNDTGLAIQFKQKDTPDPDAPGTYGQGHRFSGGLQPQGRCSFHWDNIFCPLELVVRPAGRDWHWSGSFPIPDKEDYFGLRIRHRSGRYKILPVNITVGRSGAVLVTLKSELSIPPYRVENRCKEMVIYFKQLDWNPHRDNLDTEEWDELKPGRSMPFAWDQPMGKHIVQVHGAVPGTNIEELLAGGNPRELTLDEVNETEVLHVPLGTKRGPEAAWAGAQRQSRPGDYTDQVRQQLARVWAAEFAKKVYMTIYADGPTRVLCFSEQKDIGVNSGDDENSLINLSYRLQQVCRKMKQVEHQLSGLLGVRPGLRVSGPSHKLGGVAGSVHMLDRVGSTAMPPAGRLPAIQSLSYGNLKELSSGGLGVASPSSATLRRGALSTEDETTNLDVVRHLPNFTPFAPVPSYGAEGIHSVFLAPISDPTMARRQLSNLVDRFQVLTREGTPFGGDLKVVVLKARQLPADKFMHAYVQLKIQGQVVKTNPINSSTPEWNFEETFRDVSAAAELEVGVYSLPGTSFFVSTEDLYRSSTFLGSVQIPLVATLPRRLGVDTPPAVSGGGNDAEAGAGAPKWFNLTRIVGGQRVQGQVQLAFEWIFTGEGILTLEVQELERILADKVEVLARLKPWSPSDVESRILNLSMPKAKASQNKGLSLLAGGAAVGNFGRSSTEPVRPEVGEPPDVDSDLVDAKSEATPELMSVAGVGEVDNGHVKGMKDLSELDDSLYIDLEVQVLEARSLAPRNMDVLGSALRQYIGTKELPLPVVEVSCEGTSAKVQAVTHSLSPQFPSTAMKFSNVALRSVIQLKVVDEVSSLTKKPLGEVKVPVEIISGTDPVYMWLPLTVGHGKEKGFLSKGLGFKSVQPQRDPAQVLVRIQIQKPRVKGALRTLRVDLAGLGVLAKNNSNEELLNFTLQHIEVISLHTKMEHQVSALIGSVQLDNQMIETQHPVVLAPTSLTGRNMSGDMGMKLDEQALATDKMLGEYHRNSTSGSKEGIPDGRVHPPLVRFSLARSWGRTATGDSGLGPARDDRGRQGRPGERPLDNRDAYARADIYSFKKVDLHIGALDLGTDQAFLDVVYLYMQQLPTADLWQDEEWRRRNEVMQSAGSGNEANQVKMLPSISHVHGGTHHGSSSSIVDDLKMMSWLISKEERELSMLKGQSSVWFFLEQFRISDLCITVTVSLKSSFGTSATSSLVVDSEDYQRQVSRSLLQRLTGTTGFQLINVNNVSIQLSGVDYKNKLLNKVGLSNLLIRHYTWAALAEARKVLGGAGPTIAQIPLSVIWASVSIFDLARDITASRRRAVYLLPALGHVVFTTMSQMINTCSKLPMLLLVLIPAQHDGFYSDSTTLKRFVTRPQTAPDAFIAAFRELYRGVIAGAAGLILDPVAAFRAPGSLPLLMLLVGILKGVAGLGLRPTLGILEACSKALQGLGLLCLGTEGIQGNLVRRVSAPGGAQLDTSSSPQQDHQRKLAMFQEALQYFSHRLAHDVVIDVLEPRYNRTLVLTSHHVVYLHAFRQRRNNVTYKLKWCVVRDTIDHVHGVEAMRRVVLDYRKPLKMGPMRLNIPLHRGFQCSNGDVYHEVVRNVSAYLGKPWSLTSADEATMQGTLSAAMDQDLALIQ